MIGSTVEVLEPPQEALAGGPNVAVVVRATALADGTPVIAYDFVPLDAESGEAVRTIYRNIPTEEGELRC